MKQKTYYESGKYYAVITLPNGHTYYSGQLFCSEACFCMFYGLPYNEDESED